MSYRVLQVLLCMTLASSAALRAEESGSAAEISAAFSNNNYARGLLLVREAFAKLKPTETAEAATLIKSVLTSVPVEESGSVVAAAIKSNPRLGAAVLDGAVSGADNAKQLVILSRVSYAANQNPEEFSSISAHLPSLLSSSQKAVSVSTALISPTYNPANSPSDAKFVTSPVDIRQDEKDIRADAKDIRQDDHQLTTEEKKRQADIAQLIKDLIENKPPSVIKAEQAKINEEDADVKASEKDIKADKKDLKADEKDLRQDEKGH
jgi:hypothetical protein